ncbi:MAG TPA: hypothetical protein VLS96_03710 [Nodosilinea sp.]|nr:hypothetical protein [Nodosilinea sp.]
MLNRLQRRLTPWLSSVALFLTAATAGYGAFTVAFETATIGWFGPGEPVPDGIGQGVVAFFAASTLALALLNLALKRPPAYPLIVAGGMTMTFYLWSLLLRGMMQGTILFNGAAAIFSGLNILLIRGLRVGTTGDDPPSGHWVRVGSGLLLLYLLVPWSATKLSLKTDAAREQAAVATFGTTYIAAKRTLQTCPAFHHHIGGLGELTVSPRRGAVTDKPNYAIGSYLFHYSGQQSQGSVSISVTQSKVAAPSPHESPPSVDGAPIFTSDLISVVREGDSDSTQIRCDTEPASRNPASD